MTDQERVALAQAILPVLRKHVTGREVAEPLARAILDAIKESGCTIAAPPLSIRRNPGEPQ